MGKQFVLNKNANKQNTNLNHQKKLPAKNHEFPIFGLENHKRSQIRHINTTDSSYDSHQKKVFQNGNNIYARGMSFHQYTQPIARNANHWSFAPYNIYGFNYSQSIHQ
jgi:hypothetical protein